MATGVGFIIGTIFFGPVGGVIGAAIGGAIDTFVILPSLVESDDKTAQGPRLGDRQLQQAEEGTPLNYCIGPECRTSCVVFAMGNLIEIAHISWIETPSGGKGGGDTDYVMKTEYTYHITVALAFNYGKSIATTGYIKKIWGDSKLLYNFNSNVSITDDVFGCTKAYDWYYDGSSWQVLNTYLIIDSPVNEFDLSAFKSGVNMTMSGWNTSQYNGTFKVISSRTISGAGSEVKVRSAYIAPAIPDETAGATVTLSQTLAQWANLYVHGTSFHRGALTQTPDSYLEEIFGAGNVPAFNRTAYAILREMWLGPFGNRIPNISLLIAADDSPKTIATAIGDLLERAGYAAEEYDVTGVSGNIRGYVIRGPLPTKKILQPILLGYNILPQEDNGVLKFISRADAESVTLDEDKMAAHEFGSDAPRIATISDVPGYDFPKEVNIKYIDPDNNYQAGGQRARNMHATTDRVFNLEIPLVMSPETAREVAKRILWTAYANRHKIRFSLPPSYLKILENDIVVFTAYGETYNVLVTKIDRGANFVLECEGISEKASTMAFETVAGSAGVTPDDNIYYPAETYLFILDMAPLTSLHAKSPVFYYSSCLADISSTWLGGQLLSSQDNTNFIFAGVVDENHMGVADTELGGGVTGHLWDTVNTVDVTLYHGTMSSITKEEVLQGQNWALIGDEVIGFVTATLIGTNQYRLSTLLRGLRDTSEWIDEHHLGEKIILLSHAIGSSTINQSTIGGTRYYKSVPAGGDEDDYTSVTHVHEGNTLKPFSPYRAEGSRDGSNNLTVTWYRVTRDLIRILQAESIPVLESAEVYEIDVYDNGSIVNTYTVTISSGFPTWTYSAASQTTDGLTPGDPVHVKIYQISDVVQRGKPLDATI
jgi:hypothetical protein